MSKKMLISALVLVVLGAACQVQAETVYWMGGGGVDGRWNLSVNWDIGVPDASDDVVINAGTEEEYEEIQLQTNITILSLDTSGYIDLGALGVSWIGITIANGFTNNGDIEIYTDGWIGLYADITNRSGARLELQRIDIEGIFTNEINATVAIWDEVEIIGGFDNDGIIEVDPFSEMLVEGTLFNEGLIQLYGGNAECEGTLENDENGTIKGFGLIGSEGTFINSGEIIAEGGILVLWVEGTFETTGVLGNEFVSSLQIGSVADVNNVGTMYVRSGGGIAINNDLINNGVIELMGGTLAASSITQSSGGTFSGAGTIAGNNLTIESGAEVDLTGPTNIYGDVEIGTDATLEISDGTTLVTGHTTNNGTIHMKGGRIIPQGGFTNNGNIIWEPGLYNNIADFNLDGQVNLQDLADFADTWLWQAQL